MSLWTGGQKSHIPMTSTLLFSQIAYGTTENSPLTFCSHPKDNLERKTETAGYILEHTEVPLTHANMIMMLHHVLLLHASNTQRFPAAVMT